MKSIMYKQQSVFMQRYTKPELELFYSMVEGGFTLSNQDDDSMKYQDGDYAW